MDRWLNRKLNILNILLNNLKTSLISKNRTKSIELEI